MVWILVFFSKVRHWYLDHGSTAMEKKTQRDVLANRKHESKTMVAGRKRRNKCKVSLLVQQLSAPPDTVQFAREWFRRGDICRGAGNVCVWVCVCVCERALYIFMHTVESTPVA